MEDSVLNIYEYNQVLAIQIISYFFKIRFILTFTIQGLYIPLLTGIQNVSY